MAAGSMLAHAAISMRPKDGATRAATGLDDEHDSSSTSSDLSLQDDPHAVPGEGLIGDLMKHTTTGQSKRLMYKAVLGTVQEKKASPPRKSDLQREKESVRSQNGKQRTSDQDGEGSAASFSKATPVAALIKTEVRAPDDEKKKKTTKPPPL